MASHIDSDDSALPCYACWTDPSLTQLKLTHLNPSLAFVSRFVDTQSADAGVSSDSDLLYCASAFAPKATDV